MVTKIIVISFTLVAALFFAASPTSAKSNNPNHSQEKPTKSEIVFDLPDSGDNLHPSGKDRSVEHGYSLTQGKSKSDPDDNDKGPERSNGKSDKPGSGGGLDKFDQDGNNGCGNDDDFEDDNEGWCGQKPKHDKEDKDHDKCETKCEPDENKDEDKDKDHGKDHDKCDEDKNDNGGNDSNEDNDDQGGDIDETPRTAGTVLSATTLPVTGENLNLDFALALVAFGILARKASKIVKVEEV